MKYVLIAILISQSAYGEPSNIVYNNGPVASDSGAGVCMERLRATEKDLDHQRLERNVAVTELNYQQGKSGVGTAILWTVIGVAVGGGAVYFGTRSK